MIDTCQPLVIVHLNGVCVHVGGEIIFIPQGKTKRNLRLRNIMRLICVPYSCRYWSAAWPVSFWQVPGWGSQWCSKETMSTHLDPAQIKTEARSPSSCNSEYSYLSSSPPHSPSISEAGSNAYSTDEGIVEDMSDLEGESWKLRNRILMRFSWNVLSWLLTCFHASLFFIFLYLYRNLEQFRFPTSSTGRFWETAPSWC